MNTLVTNSDQPESIDFISDLPDGVIGQILSRLYTKDAVRTSVLSRNWEYKWTNIYNIRVQFLEKDNLTNFLSFMDRVLLLTGRSTIKNFILVQDSGSKFDYSNHLKTWIQEFLSVRKVHALSIQGSQSIELDPNWFYNNSSSLTTLLLWFPGVLKVPVANNCFSNLKFLWIFYLENKSKKFEIRNEQFPSTDRISLTFPVLEYLSLECTWKNAKYVDIFAPELIDYSCRFLSNGSNDLYEIKICGSKLTSLELRGNSIPNYVLTGHPSHLMLMLEQGDHVLQSPEILKKFPKLNSLCISDGDIEALLQSSKSRLGFPALHQLKSLTLSFYNLHWPSNKDILEFLQLLPSVEYLEIYTGIHSCNQEPDHVEKTYKLPYLKEVKFVEFHGHKYEVCLAELILKNAKNVKNMRVELKRQVCETTIRHQLSKLIPTYSKCVLVVTTLGQ